AVSLPLVWRLPTAARRQQRRPLRADRPECHPPAARRPPVRSCRARTQGVRAARGRATCAPPPSAASLGSRLGPHAVREPLTEKAQEDIDKHRVPLHALPLVKTTDRLLARDTRAVGTVRDHGAPRIGNRDETRPEREL